MSLKEVLKKKNLVFGAKETVKNLKRGKVKKVYLSSNCPENVKKEIKYLCGISKVEVVELNKRNDEVGALLKKPFNISVLSY